MTDAAAKPNRIDVHYSHAAPYIRNRAAYAADSMANATTLRKKAEHRGQLFGLVSALEILMSSPEGKDSEAGIADVDTLPFGAVTKLREFLGGAHRADELLGTELQVQVQILASEVQTVEIQPITRAQFNYSRGNPLEAELLGCKAGQEYRVNLIDQYDNVLDTYDTTAE